MLLTESAETRPATVERATARRQLSGALVLSVTMLAVSGANYLINIVFARFLPPAEFGDANLAVNVVLVAAAGAATFQLLSARCGTIGDPEAIATRRTLARWAWGVGAAVGIGMALGSDALARAFSASTPLLFVVIGIGLPVYLAQAVMRGALQGDLRLERLAVSYTVEAATRIGVALAMLALGFGVVGAAVAISLSFAASALVVRRRVDIVAADHRPDASAAAGSGSGLAAVSVAATLLLVGQVVIANGDVVLAKIVMAPESAGVYAAAAVVGRGLYFLSWAVVHSTFPVVVRATSARERRAALTRALVLVGIASLVGIAGLALLGGRFVSSVLGDGYEGVADVLVPYAIATSLFATANLIASLDLAVGRWRAPCALLTGAVLQTLLLVAFGAGPVSMAMAQVVAMTFTALLVAAAHICDNRRVDMTAIHTAPDAVDFPSRRSDEHRGRRVLFLGTHGQANVGDELLLDTFLSQLGAGNTYAVNSYDPAATSAQLADRFDVSVFDTASDRLGLIRNLLWCDVVIFGGGNILKELYRSVGRWRYATLTMVFGVVVLARLARKPVLMANVGIGPVESRPGRALVRVILRLVWLISVRDEGSFRFAKSVGCPTDKLALVPDAVWVRGADAPSHATASRAAAPLRIAVNLNKDVDVADEWDRFLDRLVAARRKVAATRDVEFHALPMQCGFKSGTDLEVLTQVLSRVDAPSHIHAPADHHEVADIISACDLVVSERLHAVVLSVALGCPVVALPYDVKVRALVSQLGIDERSFDVSADLDPDALAAAILRVADGPDDGRLVDVAAGLRRQAASSFTSVRSWVQHPARMWESPRT